MKVVAEGEDKTRADDQEPKGSAAGGGSEERPRTDQDLSMDVAQCMTQFSRTFEASARRWELVVYPSLLAFIILAAYGFYLIYKLTNDVDQITDQFERIANTMVDVADEMHAVNGNMRAVTLHMEDVSETMQLLNLEVADQRVVMQAMLSSIDRMSQTMGAMSVTMHQMRFDTSTMGQNIHSAGGPMRFMNSFMPW